MIIMNESGPSKRTKRPRQFQNIQAEHYLHQTSVGPALFFQFLVLLDVFFEGGLVFLQLGAYSTLVLGLVLRLFFLSTSLMVVMVEDFFKERLLVLMGLLGVYRHENIH